MLVSHLSLLGEFSSEFHAYADHFSCAVYFLLCKCRRTDRFYCTVHAESEYESKFTNFKLTNYQHFKFKRDVYGLYQFAVPNSNADAKISIKSKKFAKLPILNTYRGIYVIDE